MLNELVTLAAPNEHDLEHDLEYHLGNKTLYSTPKIYDAKGDLSKRWYVYYSYRDPITGNLERAKNVYGKTNRFKTKEARYTLLSLYRKRLLKYLRDGYSPFDDNAEIHASFQQKTTVKSKAKEDIPEKEDLPVKENIPESIPIPQAIPIPDAIPIPEEAVTEESERMDIKTAFEFALNLKTNIVSPRTLDDYRGRCNIFIKWLAEQHPEIVAMADVSKKIATEFLNGKQLNTTARNRNNYRTALSTIFQTMEDNEIIERNFIKNIATLTSKPERNRTYTEQQQEDIFKHLEEKDPILLLFIKFIAYNYLRPIEVCRLRIKDINIKEQFLEIKVKNKPLKKKIIPDILLKQLPDLSGMAGDAMLFTPEAIGQPWDTELTNRRDYFSKRYKSIVKDHFNLDKNYGLYSFRHTSITKLYRALLINSSPHAAKSQLMQITGHSTMIALEKYLRDIDAELPADYSKHLN